MKKQICPADFRSGYSDLLQGEDEASMNTCHYIYTFYIILLHILYWHALYMHTYILHFVTAWCTVCRCSTARLSAGVCCGLTSSNVLDWIPVASSLPGPLSPLGTSQPLGSLQANEWESHRWANIWVAWQHSVNRQKEEESEHKKGGNWSIPATRMSEVVIQWHHSHLLSCQQWQLAS